MRNIPIALLLLILAAAANRLHTPSQSPSVTDDYDEPVDAPESGHLLDYVFRILRTKDQWDYSPGRPLRRLEFPASSRCRHLNGAYFDADAAFQGHEYRRLTNTHGTSLKYGAHELASDKLVKMIENSAAEIQKALATEPVTPLGGGHWPSQTVYIGAENRRRFACYMAADANNNWSRVVTNQRKFLRYIDGQRYFDITSSLRNDSGKRIPIRTRIDFDPIDADAVRADALRVWQQQASKDAEIAPIQHARSDSVSSLDRQSSSSSLGAVSDRKRNDVDEPFVHGTIHKNQHHRLAFFLMVHKDFEQVKRLLESLVDNFAVILIHVDAKAPDLKSQLQQFLDKTTAYPYKRVRIMKQSFNGLWGHSSLVFAELAGFFELLDMDANWEYVVNLSGDDYMLRHNDIAYWQMKRDQRARGKPSSYVEYWTPNVFEAISRWYYKPVFESTDKAAGTQKTAGGELAVVLRTLLKPSGSTKSVPILSHPFPDWTMYKHHQWMVLHRQHVRQMRSSPMTSTFLAYAEWSQIPDEGFFASLMRNHFSNMHVPGSADVDWVRMHVINSNLRWIHFKMGAPHPEDVTEKREKEITEKLLRNDVIACRKVKGDVIPFLEACRDIDRGRIMGFKGRRPSDVNNKWATLMRKPSRPSLELPPRIDEETILPDLKEDAPVETSSWKRFLRAKYWRDRMRQQWRRVKKIFSRPDADIQQQQ